MSEILFQNNELIPIDFLIKKYKILNSDISKNNLHRIFNSIKSSGNSFLLSFDNKIIEEIITKTAAYSNYLTDILVRNPEYLSYFLGESNSNKSFSRSDYLNFSSSVINLFRSAENKINGLIRLKRREMLRIGLRDILGLTDIETIIDEFSNLTSAILDSTFQLALQENIKKNNLKKFSREYCLISLGKLGGNELNYSSDVDLIFLYDNEKNISKNITSFEFFEKVIYSFIDFCSTNRSEGYLYRTDFRLRPDGKNSPLCRSLDNYLFYYESKGAAWERQMLLKANFLSGSKTLFERFISRLEKFIYPRSVFENPKITAHKFKFYFNKTTIKESNVKFTHGGIRDIEFSVQVLQLIFGGNFPDLRTPNTIKAIKKLLEHKLLSQKNADTLLNAYKLYRKIENFIQLANDRQTYSLPDDIKFISRLANYLEMKDHFEFYRIYKKYLKEVKQIYDEIFIFDHNEENNRSKIDFKDLTTAQNNFNIIEDGFSRSFGNFNYQKQFNSFQIIKSNIISYLKRSVQPDKTLADLTKIFINSDFANYWIQQLEDKKFLLSLLSICEYSGSLVNELSFNKKIRDFFIAGNNFITTELPIKFVNYDDNELTLLLFYLKFNFLNKKFTHEDISLALKSFYRSAIIIQTEKLIKKYKVKKESILIFSLGSFAAGELNFSSDLDLIFLFHSKKNQDNLLYQKFFTELISEIKSKLGSINIDVRLRPEGKSSQLAWQYEEFLKYIDHRAKVWEFQAYTKIDTILCDNSIFFKIKENIKKRLQLFDPKTILKEINSNKLNIKRISIMPSKNSINLKLSDGGILDIQFLFQSLEMLDYLRNNFQSFLKTNKSNKKFDQDLILLKKNYEILKRSIIIIYLLKYRQKPLILNEDKNDLRFNSFLDLKKNENTFDKLNSILSKNSDIIKMINLYLLEYLNEIN